MRTGLSLLAFAMITTIVVWNNAASLAKQLATAERTRKTVQSDHDLYRLSRLLGPEATIVDQVRQRYPPGTAISIPWPGDRHARRVMLGFWFSLLPDYPVQSGGTEVICLRSQLRSTDQVVALGKEFVLVERRGDR